MRVLDGRVWRYALIDRPPQIALDTGLYEFHAHAAAAPPLLLLHCTAATATATAGCHCTAAAAAADAARAINPRVCICARGRQLQCARGRQLQCARGRQLHCARGRQLHCARGRQLHCARGRRQRDRGRQHPALGEGGIPCGERRHARDSGGGGGGTGGAGQDFSRAPRHSSLPDPSPTSPEDPPSFTSCRPPTAGRRRT